MHPSNSSDRFAISFAANHNPHISMWKYILFISVQPDGNSDESAILRRLETFSNYNRFQTISMDIRIVGKDYDGVLGGKFRLLCFQFKNFTEGMRNYSNLRNATITCYSDVYRYSYIRHLCNSCRRK